MEAGRDGQRGGGAQCNLPRLHPWSELFLSLLNAAVAIRQVREGEKNRRRVLVYFRESPPHSPGNQTSYMHI